MAAVNAQYSLAPVSPTVAYGAPHVAVSAVPYGHYPVAHYPVAHAAVPVAHVPVAHVPIARVQTPGAYARIISQSQDSSPDGSYSFR